jgi:hypothetical protein
VALLFVLADVAMREWQRSSNVNLETFEQHADIWFQPLRIAFSHIRQSAELKKIICLAAGVNLIVGVTLASSAAMVIGSFGESKDVYAALQASGALVTILILFGLARMTFPLSVLGGVSYCAITVGALITATGASFEIYLLGFLLVVGFDKMFNVYMRTIRQRVIPVRDFGKTVGVITLLNNLTQPLAGLWVGVLAVSMGLRGVILALAVAAVLIGLAVTIVTRTRVTTSVES